MLTSTQTRLRSGFAAVAVMLSGATAALAHPHVSVTAAVTVNIDNGAIASISHVWTFDEFYTAQAIDGLPKNKDGLYGRPELAELAKVNIDGLKEFGYFTFATLDKTELKVGDPNPSDYWLEHNNGVLSLHFTVPLEKPVLADAKGFGVVLTDPSYFIAFELAAKDGAKLNAAAPQNCKIEVAEQKDETPEEKKLGGAFAQQMSSAAMLGSGAPKMISVRCN
jgi:ABC-type uncharacterized transport system substrate-binding protein